MLKLLFVVLLIAVIGEVAYLLMLPKTPVETGSNRNVATPTEAYQFLGPRNDDLPPAFNINTLDNLSIIPYYPNTKATIVTESRNKVVDVRTDEIFISGIKSPLGIKYEYEKGLERWVHFQEADIPKMKVFLDESGGGIKTPANFTDIKKGDTVLMINKMNPFYPYEDPRLVVEIELDIIR